MKKYKYKVGQKVKYIVIKYIEKVICECCEDTETEYKEIKIKGKIIRRRYGILDRPRSVKYERGTAYNMSIQLAEPEPIYTIKKTNGKLYDVCEDEIIKTSPNKINL